MAERVTLMLVGGCAQPAEVALAGSVKSRVAAHERHAGISFLGTQVFLLCVALSLSGIQLLLADHASLITTMIFTLVTGNIVTGTLLKASPLFERPFPRNWVVFFVVMVPLAYVASAVGGVVERLILGVPLRTLRNLRNGDIPFGALIGFALGTGMHIYSINRAKLQAVNSQLAEQVQYGQQELAAQASELRDAFEIQSSLLPKKVPQIAGVEISCAWQPARTVSGDYFDVLVLSESRIAFCLADVSGKGMSAALITANLQATLRAFAPDEDSPARLCQRLNHALCPSLPTGRFVTLVYGILDRKKMTLTYELAGHNPPILLRGAEVILLAGSGPVLGILPEAVFADQTIALRMGDRLVLSTDGVTEAFDPAGEEFGEERLIAAAQKAGDSAHGIRTEVMREVGAFAEGNFHDDASLMVVRVQES